MVEIGLSASTRRFSERRIPPDDAVRQSRDPRVTPKMQESYRKFLKEQQEPEDAEPKRKIEEARAFVEEAFSDIVGSSELQHKQMLEQERVRSLNREVTPAIRASARDFSVAWLEFCRLEQSTFAFPETGSVLDTLKPYAGANGIHVFTGQNENAISPEDSWRLQVLADGICRWYENRPTDPEIIQGIDKQVLDNIGTSTQLAGDWITQYAVELGMPGADVMSLFGRLKSVDPGLFKHLEHNYELALMKDAEFAADVLGSHFTRNMRIEWYKQQQARYAALVAELRDAIGSDAVTTTIKFSELQDIREAVRPVWDAAPFPIYGKKMPDSSTETALLVSLGDIFRSAKSDEEIKALQENVTTWEDLLAYHALSRESSGKRMPKEKAEALLKTRNILREAILEKLDRVRSTAAQLELFQKRPDLERFVTITAVTWLLFVDFGFWMALPHKEADLQVLHNYMSDLYINSRNSLRRIYTMMSPDTFISAESPFVPRDLPSETPFGYTPLDMASKTMPIVYTDPTNGKVVRLGVLQEDTSVPTEDDAVAADFKQSLVNQENRRKKLYLILAALVCAVLAAKWLLLQIRLASTWGDFAPRLQRWFTRAFVTGFNAMDRLFYWTKAALEPELWRSVKTVISFPFSTFSKSLDEREAIRRDALSLYMQKREVESRLFMLEATRPQTADDSSRVLSAKQRSVNYSTRNGVISWLDSTPAVVRTRLTPVWNSAIASTSQLSTVALPFVFQVRAGFTTVFLYVYPRLLSVHPLLVDGVGYASTKAGYLIQYIRKLM